ncbi:MAG: PH domain-containing protein [Mycobacterium sp.]
MTRGSDASRTIIRISPLAHFASAFLAMALLTVGPAFGLAGMAALMVVPVLISVAVERFRTTADQDNVTARTMLKSRTMPWSAIEGLKFTRGRWARACRGPAGDVVLPAVTFSTLPTLTAASGGKVPNPYQR